MEKSGPVIGENAELPSKLYVVWVGIGNREQRTGGGGEGERGRQGDRVKREGVYFNWRNGVQWGRCDTRPR